MKNTAIIAEYNPFHNGHKFHIEQTKQTTNADFVFVVMSSSFVQRGESAIYDKWTRTKAALAGGADMVIELPVIYSNASAESFARGAVKIISSTGIANNLAFGAETDDIDSLISIAALLSKPSEAFKFELKSALSKGLSFPLARAKAINSINPIYADISNSPNNILAIEYLKALNLFKSNISPYLIHRTTSEYNSDKIIGEIASATAVRKAVLENKLDLVNKTVPQNCFEIYNEANPIFADDFSQALGYVLRSMSIEDLSNISGISEGLENRIIKTIGNHKNLSDICMALKTKRYTYTRIMRTLFHIILGISKEHDELFSPTAFEPYIRVLGFKQSAQPLLRALSENASVPVIMNVNKDEGKLNTTQKGLLDLEKKATDIYYLPKNGKRFLDYTMPIIIEKDM